MMLWILLKVNLADFSENKRIPNNYKSSVERLGFFCLHECFTHYTFYCILADMKIYVLFFLSFVPCLIYAQTTLPLSSLENEINESSGLIYLNNTLITHNDSDQLPNLYEVDPTTGNVTRTVHVANAQNKDWEDIATDDTYIYIGDFGNNQGNRTDLKIYRIGIDTYLNTPNDTVYADSILFNYADQTDFSTSNFTTPYDAEALICFRDSLFIFTKNWSNSTTAIYSIPKTPGSYSSIKQDSINTGFLVTGADYDTLNQKIALIGYGFNSATLLEIGNITGKISAATISSFAINCSESYQVEGVAYSNNNCLHISAEQHSSGAAILYELCTPNLYLLELQAKQVLVYPNPVSECLHISLSEKDHYTVTSSFGSQIYSGKEPNLDVRNLSPGVYFIHILGAESNKNYQFIKK